MLPVNIFGIEHRRCRIGGCSKNVRMHFLSTVQIGSEQIENSFSTIRKPGITADASDVNEIV